MLKPLHIERYVKGFANHNRIKILLLLNDQTDLSLQDIARKLRINFKTAGEHTRRLAIAGLIMKRHNSKEVEHAITNRGKNVLKFLRTLE